jgi:hypothetical protein
MIIQRNYTYQEMAQHPLFKVSQRLLMRRHSSPASLKSQPIYETEYLKKIKNTLLF